MIAVVQIGGEQLRVEKGKVFTVNRLDEKSGTKLSFNNVLLIENNGSVEVGNPIIEKASISISILEHLKGKKVIVFKKKRRKGYKVKNGHRQHLTKIKIEDILLTEKKTSTAKKKTSTVKKKTSTVKKKTSTVKKKKISKPKV